MRQNPPVVGDRGADAINRLTRTGPRVGFSRSHKSAGFTPRSRSTLAGVGRLLSVARRTYGWRVRSEPNQSYARTLCWPRTFVRTAGAHPQYSPFPTFVCPRYHKTLTSIDARQPLIWLTICGRPFGTGWTVIASNAGVAREKQLTLNQRVQGSNPCTPTPISSNS